MSRIADCWFTLSGCINDTDKSPYWGVVFYYQIDDNFESAHLRNDSRLLALAVVTGQAPVGVLLDRLEEHPDDAIDMPADLVLQCVQYLREQFPDGVCPVAQD
jgi:hypothetical protein